jgi:hypothetical protein
MIDRRLAGDEGPHPAVQGEGQLVNGGEVVGIGQTDVQLVALQAQRHHPVSLGQGPGHEGDRARGQRVQLGHPDERRPQLRAQAARHRVRVHQPGTDQDRAQPPAQLHLDLQRLAQLPLVDPTRSHQHLSKLHASIPPAGCHRRSRASLNVFPGSPRAAWTAAGGPAPPVPGRHVQGQPRAHLTDPRDALGEFPSVGHRAPGAPTEAAPWPGVCEDAGRWRPSIRCWGSPR